MTTLLAKSQDVKSITAARTLVQHIDDCLVIFEFLKTTFPKAAVVSKMGERFWNILYVSIICHDLGKAHQEFQLLLNNNPNQWQYQRHELFSIPFVEALTDHDKDTIHLVKLAVAGHHKDFEALQKQLAFYEAGESFGMLDTLDERNTFAQAFRRNIRLQDALDLLKTYSINVKPINAKSIEGLIRSYIKSPYKEDNPMYFALMTLLGGLKWCDHLGSAIVSSLFKLNDDDFRFLHHGQYKFYDHQKQCAKSVGNAMLTAPTGSGKTESALLWLQNQLKHIGQGRVFYILPFTASINAMFERLKKEIGAKKVGMVHGKLNDYLNNYFDDLQYDIHAKKRSIYNLKQQFKSLITPIKVTTPFQLLKHLFGLKGFEQGIFELTGSYLIFDEIHAYNPETFAQIKVLIEFATQQLNAKVMIMTATMPQFMLSELKASIQPFSTIRANDSLYRSFRRHKIILKEGLLANSVEEISSKLTSGKKVLVVCNTVKSSQYVFKQLKTLVIEGEATLLHGSFTGKDRSDKEKDLTKEGVKLLVGTQAIEVSLDIDYDTIYTEPAPIDALIQRFGRVNRKRAKGICHCFVFTGHNPEDEHIYNPVAIERTIVALSKIVNQRDGIIEEAVLQDSIDEVYNDWDETDKKKFDEQYNYLKEALKSLSPLMRNKYTEEDFYKQFDGIKILPQCNKDIYQEYLNHLDFISAESQKIQIGKGRFMGWLQSGNIKKELFTYSKNNNISTELYYITNKFYSPELGLMANQEEPWQNVEIF